MRFGRVLGGTFLGPICRPSNRRSEILNEGIDVETSLEERSHCERKYDEDNLNIAIRHRFSESSMLGPSKF